MAVASQVVRLAELKPAAAGFAVGADERVPGGFLAALDRRLHSAGAEVVPAAAVADPLRRSAQVSTE